MILTLALLGCKPSPPADPEFNDAVQYGFREFETDSEANLAFALRTLEVELYESLDLGANSVLDRSLTPATLTEEDVAGIPRPDMPTDGLLGVVAARLSPFELPLHAPVMVMTDQTAVEPYSPDHYDRSFPEGNDDCFPDNGCSLVRSWNELTRENILMVVTYDMHKDFRWVDLALPDPSSVPVGEEPVNTGEPRWGIVSRGWMPTSATGEGATFEQSYSLEVWFPRDGRGYTGGEFDSTGGGLLRVMGLWSESTFDSDFSDDIVTGTMRSGIDSNFEATDDFVEEQQEG